MPPSEIIDHPHQWFGGRTYAQHGDDLVIVNIFHRLGIQRPSYLDIGAFHPFDLSNTALLYARGSRGINVEANPDLMEAFCKSRPEDVNLNAAVAEKSGLVTLYRAGKDNGRNSTLQDVMHDLPVLDEIQVEALTVSRVVQIYANGEFPDFLTIDIEGRDAAVLKSCDFSRTSPKVICAEADAGTGSVATDLIALMRGKGFFCCFKPGSNLIFVRDDYRELL